MFDALITGGRVVTDSGLAEADLAIEAGRIAAWLPRNSGVAAHETYSADGLHVFPGMIDAHAHVDLGPGDQRYRESASAAVGGITTFITFLITGDPYEDIFEDERAKAEAESYVDVGFHFGAVSQHHADRLPMYASKLGVPSFKHFMNFKGSEGAYIGVEGGDDGRFYDFCSQVAKTPGSILMVHPENIEIVWRLTEQLKRSGRSDLAAYSESRPELVEYSAIQTALTLGHATGAPIYIVHNSCTEGVQEMRHFRSRYPGVPAFLETCPHYLTHTRYEPIGSLGKVNPPLRDQDDIESLWEGLRDGTIDVVASDHVPRRREKKEGGVWKASAGFPGMATIFPVLITEGFHKRSLSLQRIVEVASTNPAKIFGMYPQKGSLEPSSDADLILVDLEARQPVTAQMLESYADYSLYEGWEMSGFPQATFVRGKPVVLDGKLVGEPGHGRFVRRGVLAASEA